MAKPRAKDDPDLTVAEWDAKIADLRKRLAETKAGLATLSDRRRGIALAVTAGDAAATEELAKLNAQAAELLSAEDMLGMGIETAQQSRDAAAKQEALAAEAERLRQVQFVSRELLAASREADTALKAAAEALRKRHLLGVKLSRLGHHWPRLISGDSAARAAHHHGLAELLNLPRQASNPHIKSLVEGDAPVLRLRGEAPAEDAA